jgi:hypothetical protein
MESLSYGQGEFKYTSLFPISLDTGWVNGTVGGTPLSSFNIIILPPGINFPSSNSTSSPPFYQGTSITNYAPDLGVAQGHVFHSTYMCPKFDPGTAIPQGGNGSPVYGEQLGLDQYAVANLNTFIQNGGTVLCEDSATSSCTSNLGGITTYPSTGHNGVYKPLPGITRVSTSSVYGPGLVVQLSLNSTANNPMTFGYTPGGTTPAFWESSSAMTVSTGAEVIASYSTPTFLSGYLYDPSNVLPGKVAAAWVPVGSGKVVLLGFRALERDQADATFMMYFDAIYASTAVSTALP